jgi:peptide methionine sulfoxide reductase msrA/msrB
MNDISTIYLAGGCFWGVQNYLARIPGVVGTQVGYANSNVKQPSYEAVCSGATNAAEAVGVDYDSAVLSLDRLLFLFFDIIDPTSLNRQGNDVGTQYRTGIYYTDAADLPTIKAALQELGQRYTAPLAIELAQLNNFYPAEIYHQDYLDKNPGGYCHISPGKFAGVAKRAELIPKIRELTPLQYGVTQQNATEPPFANEYFDEFGKGIYVDVITGEPLFISADKFESGCGWPAFSKPIEPELLKERMDNSLGAVRTEVRAANSDSHLGHVFTDDPADSGGLRYCINSAALRFVPAQQMEAQGYGELLELLS